MSIPLAALEEIIDASGVAPRAEALLPVGVRHRQLRVRTLLAGSSGGRWQTHELQRTNWHRKERHRRP